MIGRRQGDLEQHRSPRQSRRSLLKCKHQADRDGFVTPMQILLRTEVLQDLNTDIMNRFSLLISDRELNRSPWCSSQHLSRLGNRKFRILPLKHDGVSQQLLRETLTLLG